MKRIAVLLLAVLMLLSLAACGQEKPAPKPEEIKTLGDAMAVESPYAYSSYDDQNYVYVFELGGTPMRAIAVMTDELSAQSSDIDADPMELMEQISALPVEKLEDLSSYIPTQAELDALKGKTGQELLDEGFEINGYRIDGKHTEYTLDKGMIEYTVVFNETVRLDDSFDEGEAIKPLTVKSASYLRIAFAAAEQIGEF